jgi:RNA polymerase sigma-70 factor (ECF subfamily)
MWARPVPVEVHRTIGLADYPYVDVRQADTEVVVDREEFGSFFRSHYVPLVRAFCVLTADRAEAEDLAQEALARAYERWDRVSTMESPSGYVYRVGVNLNRHRIRHLAVRARRTLALRRDAVSGDTPELRVELAEAIASLPRGQREAFMLVECLGWTAEEAAPILGLAPASVRSRLHRARAALRDRLEPEEGPKP